MKENERISKLTREEVDRILIEAYSRKKRDGIIIELTVTCGLKGSELRNLRIDDIDFESKGMLIRGRAAKEYEHVPLPTELCNRIHKFIGVEKSGFLFGKNAPLSTRRIQQVTNEYGKRVRIEKRVTPSTLRESFIVRSLEKGMKPEILKAILGEANLRIAGVNVSITYEDIDREFRRIWD